MAKKKYPGSEDVARVDVEQLRASGKPEWAMSAAERTALRVAENREWQQRKNLWGQRRKREELARQAPSDVTVTHADGSVTVEKAYTQGKADYIINVGNERLPEVRRQLKEQGYGGDDNPFV